MDTMIKRLRMHVRVSNVLALIALFAAVGGGAFAATKAAKDSVVSKSIKDGKVKSIDIQDNALASDDLAGGAVRSDELGDGAVTTQKLGDEAVTEQKLGNDAVTSQKILDDSVGSAEITADAVGTSEIANGSVTLAKLAAEAQPNVVAYGRVNNPDPGAPSLQSAVGLTSINAGADGSGETLVGVSSDVVPGPGANLAQCTILATLATDAANGTLGEPGFVNVAFGSPQLPGRVQVQTRDHNAGVADRDYYLQVTCPPA